MSGPIRFVPAAVAVPADLEDVMGLVVWAGEEGLPLVPKGAGTGMPGGNVGPGVAVDMGRLAEMPHPREIGDAVRVGPGVLGGALQSAAQAAGRFFPPLPSSADRCTLGGMVASNAAGTRTFRYGAVREWVEAIEVVLADGTLARLERGRPEARFETLRTRLLAIPGLAASPWPRVRKNSSGYLLDGFLPSGDPVQLMAGSEGTLGIVTALRLRLAPEPGRRALGVMSAPDLDALDVLAAEARRIGASTCEFFGSRFLDLTGLRSAPAVARVAGDAAALVLLEVEGDEEAIEGRLGSLDGLARCMGTRLEVGRTQAEMDRFWHVRNAASPVIAARAEEGLVSMQFIEDSVVPDGCLSRYLRGLDEILRAEETDAVVFGHAGDGNVHVNPLVDVRRPDWRERVRRTLEATVDLVASLGGTLSGEHGDGRIRAPFHERIFGASMAHAFHMVKSSLDPAGILNPGVVIPEKGHDPLLGLTPRRKDA